MRDARIFWLPAAFVAMGCVAAACDDGAGHDFGGYQPYGSTSQTSNATEPGDAGTTGTRAQSSDGGAGAKGAGDGAAGESAPLEDGGDADADAGPPATAFTDAGPFAPDAGPTTRQPQHNFAGNTPTTNPAQQQCLDCHFAGGPALAFVYAGTVYGDAAGTTPAAGVEVRVRDANGNVASVYTDVDGNFFQRSIAIGFAAQAGVRNAAATTLMVADATAGNCNTCHKAATVIHVP